jgi:tetratricopeptide (TPR) repeat protein
MAEENPEKTSQKPPEKPKSLGSPGRKPGSPLGLSSIPRAGGRTRGFPTVSLLLALNTILVCFVIGVILSTLWWKGSGSEAVLILHEAPDTPQSQPSPDAAPVDLPQALSWKEAEDAYAARNYGGALVRYNQLVALSRSEAPGSLVEDFLRFRVAQCLGRLERVKEARLAFDQLSRSRSPAVQAAANYAQAAFDAAAGQHLQARIRAYLAIAAAGRLQSPLALEADCDYLICRVLTEKVLACYGETGPTAWREWKPADPFAGLDEAALVKLLQDGVQTSGESVLSPALTRNTSPSGAIRWSVACPQASIEDLLARWATAAGSEVKWGPSTPAARGRAVSLYHNDLSEQRLCEIACGSAGLLARFMPTYVLVDDPQGCASAADQRDMLWREASIAWRRFFLRYPEDDRVGEGHAAVACLCDCSGDTATALKEYQLVAHRYSRSGAAPDALLASAKLRVRLRDYAGAQNDLTSLLDAFPAYVGADEAYLYLGKAMLEGGNPQEAFWSFKKLYDLNLSASSQAKACLGAAECQYRQGNHEKMVKWLTLYLGLVKEPVGEEPARAYFLLSKTLTAQGKTDDAVGALRRSLEARPPKKQYVDTIIELARAYAAKESYAKAVGALRLLDGEKLTEEQTYQYLLQRTRMLRSMGLVEEARAFLQDRISGLTDAQNAAALKMELARCHQDAGDLWEARRLMGDVLGTLKVGEEAWSAACELGEICLKLGDPSQAAGVVGEVLKSSCPTAIRRRALEVLGAAYLAQHDYEKAALALSGLAAKDPQGKNP